MRVWKTTRVFCGIMWEGPHARTIRENFRKTVETRGSLQAKSSRSENFPQECHMFRLVKRWPHLGHFQSGLLFPDAATGMTTEISR
jgi:hypothetical protein